MVLIHNKLDRKVSPVAAFIAGIAMGSCGLAFGVVALSLLYIELHEDIPFGLNPALLFFAFMAGFCLRSAWRLLMSKGQGNIVGWFGKVCFGVVLLTGSGMYAFVPDLSAPSHGHSPLNRAFGTAVIFFLTGTAAIKLGLKQRRNELGHLEPGDQTPITAATIKQPSHLPPPTT